MSTGARSTGRSSSTATPLPFDDACAERYGIIRTELELAGTPIGPNDLMIAATALAHGRPFRG